MLLGHRFRDRTIILVHHEGRSSKPRGTSKGEDVLDTIIRIQERKDITCGDQEAAFELSFTKTRDFTAQQPLILRLSTASGTAAWTCETKRDHVRERVADLLAEGWQQMDIVTELNLSKGRVSQIAAELNAAKKDKPDIESGARSERQERTAKKG